MHVLFGEFDEPRARVHFPATPGSVSRPEVSSVLSGVGSMVRCEDQRALAISGQRRRIWCCRRPQQASLVVGHRRKYSVFASVRSTLGPSTTRGRVRPRLNDVSGQIPSPPTRSMTMAIDPQEFARMLGAEIMVRSPTWAAVRLTWLGWRGPIQEHLSPNHAERQKLPPPVQHDRPFPWRCACREKQVFPLETDFTTEVKHNGRLYTVRVPDLAIPTCRNCGETALYFKRGRSYSRNLAY